MSHWAQHELHDEQQELVLGVDAGKKVDLRCVQTGEAVARDVHKRLVMFSDETIRGVIKIYEKDDWKFGVKCD